MYEAAPPQTEPARRRNKQVAEAVRTTIREWRFAARVAEGLRRANDALALGDSQGSKVD